MLVEWFGGPGGDRLFRGLRRSTMGAGGFHGRVRDGIGCGPPAKATRSSSPSEIGLNEVLVSSGSTRGSALRAAFPGKPGDKLRMISMHGRITSSIGRLGP